VVLVIIGGPAVEKLKESWLLYCKIKGLRVLGRLNEEARKSR